MVRTASSRFGLCFQAVCFGLLAFVPGPALYAQELEEVVVTATKRELDVGRVPVSVAVVSENTLKQLNTSNVRDLQRLLPSFQWTGGSSGLVSSTYIRGVGTLAFTIALEQSAGTAIDGVPIGRVLGSFLDAVDVQRVELLRGPQGMLFGKNATAGLVHLVTNSPKYESEFSGRVYYGSLDELRLQTVANLPIVDGKLAARVAAWKFKRDGYVKQPLVGKDGNSVNDWGARAKLLWEPTDALSMTLAIERGGSDTTCCTWVYSRNTPGTATYAADAAVGIFASKKNWTVASDYGSTTVADSSAYSLNVDYSMGDYKLVSTSAYREYDSHDNFDADFSPLRVSEVLTSGGPTHQFTQEIRLLSPTDREVEWVAGLFYFDLGARDEQDQRLDFGPLLGIPRLPLGRVNSSAVTSESYAAFAEATWRLQQRLRLITGFRLSKDDTKGSFSRVIPPGYFPFSAGSVALAFSNAVKYDDFSWRLGLQSDVSENSMFYVTASKGYKGPGFNFSNDLSPSQVALNGAAVDAETVRAYEIGAKSRWFDGRFSVNAALFHSTFDGLQATAFLPTVPLSVGILNVPESVTKGVELEVAAKPVENLTINASIAYTDAKFTVFPNGPCYANHTPANGCVGGVQNLAGRELPNAPKLAGFFQLRYDHKFARWPLTGYIQPSYYYRDAVQSEPNQTVFSKTDSAEMVNLALGLRTIDGRWEFALIGKNILDRHFLGRLNQGVLDAGRETIHVPTIDARRLWGISAQFNF